MNKPVKFPPELHPEKKSDLLNSGVVLFELSNLNNCLRWKL